MTESGVSSVWNQTREAEVCTPVTVSHSSLFIFFRLSGGEVEVCNGEWQHDMNTAKKATQHHLAIWRLFFSFFLDQQNQTLDVVVMTCV